MKAHFSKKPDEKRPQIANAHKTVQRQTKGLTLEDNRSATIIQQKEHDSDSSEKAENTIPSEVIQRVKQTPAQKLAKLRKLGIVTSTSKLRRAGKLRPKRPGRYTVKKIGSRNYYSEKDHLGRITKFAGGLKYYKGKRIATPKVPYKRKNDQAGHLIAHSFGGPPKFTDNFVAMNKKINSKGGKWGKMESYIRTRLQQSGIKVWMSVQPHYDGIKKRPIRIEVSLTFNRSPFKVRFNIPTP